ncbi:hypothetical protein BV22DRAFT_920976 [Leucogyrophana mollusca]|uniref:Uncharacterized protein n=1 Tax=Leucogyrophana mollusca TaxID=85980 RepID=A0ACB8AYD3_9AGAM|nr:hypothetical protein BV22DRAFT_920976 [Leucogyrophana mollusca]
MSFKYLFMCSRYYRRLRVLTSIHIEREAKHSTRLARTRWTSILVLQAISAPWAILSGGPGAATACVASQHFLHKIMGRSYSTHPFTMLALNGAHDELSAAFRASQRRCGPRRRSAPRPRCTSASGVAPLLLAAPQTPHCGQGGTPRTLVPRHAYDPRLAGIPRFARVPPSCKRSYSRTWSPPASVPPKRSSPCGGHTLARAQGTRTMIHPSAIPRLART